jgi:molybdopterin-dependent oxidoreductase alpha subunit
VRVNGDVALLQGIMKEMLEEERRRPGRIFDHEFIAAHTDGFAALTESLEAARWEELVEESGVERAQIRAAAEIAWTAKRTIACWAMGLTQHRNAVANIQEVVNLLLLRGNVGRPGAGLCPVRGHSNVQGDRTMGIWERMDGGFLDRLGRRFAFSPPRPPGLDTVGAIEAMRAGRVRLFVSLGGNFQAATPDTERTSEGLRRCLLTVQISTTLNRAHLVTGKQALILPCLGRSERDLQETGGQFVTVEDSMGLVHASRGPLAPVSAHLRSEPAIVAGLARACLPDSAVPWQGLAGDYDRIREDIAAVIPGFEDFNARVRRPGGFALPNAARARRWSTPTGKARFTVHARPRHQLGPGQLLMMTIRSHDQFNTTIYGLDDRYRGVRGGRRVVFLNQEDMNALGLAAGQIVDLHSQHEGQTRTARHFQVVPFAIPRRCAATYFPETNVLVPLGALAEKSRTPASKSIVISLTTSRQSTVDS